MTGALLAAANEKYRSWYGHPPAHTAYAPGRIEVLGNHTDYNGGLVLSAAIDYGTLFLVSGGSDRTCRIVAGDLMEMAEFPLDDPEPRTDHSWPNYGMGVAAGLREAGVLDSGFDGLFFGNVPIGGGLSSSAALGISCALSLARLGGRTLDTITLARIGQSAENEYVGAQTGLLDQISSLSGKESALVYTDFRSLQIETVPFPEELVLVAVDTPTRHSLGASAYNERREDCEAAVSLLSPILGRSISSLREVSTQELEANRHALPARIASRAQHVIGEIARVEVSVDLLREGDINRFGEMMMESHESSRSLFENSTDELDWIVEEGRRHEWIRGARLSGGGFGGNAVLLTHSKETDRTIEVIEQGFGRRFGRPCHCRVVRASSGARLIDS